MLLLSTNKMLGQKLQKSVKHLLPPRLCSSLGCHEDVGAAENDCAATTYEHQQPLVKDGKTLLIKDFKALAKHWSKNDRKNPSQQTHLDPSTCFGSFVLMDHPRGLVKAQNLSKRTRLSWWEGAPLGRKPRLKEEAN